MLFVTSEFWKSAIAARRQALEAAQDFEKTGFGSPRLKLKQPECNAASRLLTKHHYFRSSDWFSCQRHLCSFRTVSGFVAHVIIKASLPAHPYVHQLSRMFG